MPPRLAWARASVETPTGGVADVRVLLAGGTLTAVDKGGHEVLRVEGVTAAVRGANRRSFVLSAPEGEFIVTRAGGCGCGGGK